jgi:hypothetical protein
MWVPLTSGGRNTVISSVATVCWICPSLIQEAQGITQATHPDSLDGELAQVFTGLDIGKVQLFGCIHGAVSCLGPGRKEGYQGRSARAFSMAFTRVRLSGEVVLGKLDTFWPLRSIRYLWKFHFGRSPVRDASWR